MSGNQIHDNNKSVVKMLFFLLHIDYNVYNQFYYKYNGQTMVSVARPWLICDYHGLIVTKCFLFFYLHKTMVHFVNTSTPDDVMIMIIKHISS